MENINVILSGSLFIITFIILILASYSIHRKVVQGAIPFFFLCIVTSFYTFGYGMELFSQTIEKVDFWSKFQYVGLPFIPAIWFILSISYSRTKRKYNKAFYFFLFLIPLLTSIFRWTSAANHLQYGAMRMVTNGYFLIIHFEKGPWYYFHFAFFAYCTISACINYLKVYRKVTGYPKQQTKLMLIASVVGLSSMVMNIFSLFPFKLDSGPFIVVINYFLFTYGIFRYNMLHLIPLSREKIFDWIHDGVIVFDIQFDIIDYNIAATRIFTELSKQVIGLNVKECLREYVNFIEPLTTWGINKNKSKTGKNSVPPIYDFEFEKLNDATQQLCRFNVRLSELYENEYLVGATVMINDITKQHEMIKQLEHNSRTDGLTNLLNRSYFFERMEYEISRANRFGTSFAIIIMDIDFFKQVNDTYGHQAGDYVLKEISAIIVKCLREIDLIGRYGGEEFIIFLPETTLERAMTIANRIRINVETTDFNWSDNRIRSTASFGVSAYACKKQHNLKEYDTLLRKADEALYRAKQNGRNRVEASM